MDGGDSVLFWLFSAAALFCAFKSAFHRNPVYGALYLAGVMIALAGLFFLLGAFFIAGVQLAVYAGAVIVLFTLVLMLFDLKEETGALFAGRWTFLRAGAPLFLFGAVSASVFFAMISRPASERLAGRNLKIFEVKEIGLKIFTKYLLVFEVLGLLLLLIAVGVVALTRLEKEDAKTN